MKVSTEYRMMPKMSSSGKEKKGSDEMHFNLLDRKVALHTPVSDMSFAQLKGEYLIAMSLHQEC